LNDQEQQTASEAGVETQSRKTKKTRAIKYLSGADFITSLVLVIFGAAMYFGALNMRKYAIFYSSPGFFPMILGIIFVFFGFSLLYTSYLRGGWADALRIITVSNLKKSVASPIFKKCSVIFLLICIYVALLGKIDFVYLSMGYLFLTFCFLKAAKWYWMILIAVVAPILIEMVFVNFFRIPMP